jgi:hypothetical protein
MAPHFSEQLLPRHDRAIASHQRHEQGELARRQCDVFAESRDALCVRLDLDCTEAHDVGRRTFRQRRGATQHGLDTREQLEQTERLRNEIISAHAEAAHLVRFLSVRRQDDDRRLDPLFAERAQHAESIETGHHQVENDEVGLPRTSALEAG